MVNIIKQAWLMFKKTPGYIHTMTTFPIVYLLLLTVVLAYSKNHNISVIDLSTDGSGKVIYKALNGVEGLTIIDTDYDDAVKKMIGGNIELTVVLNNNGNTEIIRLSEGSEVEKTVTTIINAVNSEPEDRRLEVAVNPVEEKGLPISYGLGIMLFKFITASGIMAGILIREKNSGMRDRILLSGISPFSYLTGKAAVYFGSMVMTATAYYTFCLVFNFDFGMRNSIWFFVMVLVASLFSVGVYSLFASVLKEEGMLWSIGTFIFFPMAILSGALFPYSSMPAWMQTVGAYVPQRWISGSIELIQKSDSIVPALPYIGLTLTVAASCYIMALRNISRR